MVSGKRRSSSSVKQSRDVENNTITSSDHSNSNGSPGNNGHVNNTGGSSSSSGIDNFLHRLNDDPDLRNMKKRSHGGRKSSDLEDDDGGNSIRDKQKPTTSSALLKRIAMSLASLIVLGLIYDTLTSPPEKRLLGSQRIHDFLFWVKENPGTGAAAFIFVYGTCVALLLPGTPLTLGGGYVYKVAYGWAGGVAMATFTSMAGSLFGSCSCFVMGRYIMRDRVRKWGRKYPIFDAIDVAVSDNGFKIMCLLYLTPILPLGPVSYMCGTTSMPLHKFAMAKIAALPLMLLYVLIGASTDTFFGSRSEDDADAAADGTAAVKKVHGLDEETHRKMVLFGLILSIISMSLVSHFVKKELYKIFDKQKKDKSEREELNQPKSRSNLVDDDQSVEMISAYDKLLRRPRGHHLSERSESGLQDEESAC